MIERRPRLDSHSSAADNETPSTHSASALPSPPVRETRCNNSDARAFEESCRGDGLHEEHADGDAEDRLLAAAISGSVQAFAALYDLYVERVYRHVYYRVGNRADAEDLTQQVFVQAWEAIGRFRRTGAPFVAWLFTISHNLLVSSHRRTRETQPLDEDVAVWARWANPEVEALTRFDRMAVREAILHLKPEQQQVIIMRFVEDIDYAAIAAALGKSAGNIRIIQHRALLELRRLLAHEVKA